MTDIDNRGFIIRQVTQTRLLAIEAAYENGTNSIAAVKELVVALEEVPTNLNKDELNALFTENEDPSVIGNAELALLAIAKVKDIIESGVKNNNLSLALTEEELNFLKKVIEEAESSIANMLETY